MKPRRRAAVTHRPWGVDPHSVFINIPYDDDFEPLFLALIAGLCGFGLTPRATLEIPTSERRLDRIFRLIRTCRYSLHDVSRVELDRKPPPTPRFNMPFELGLAVAWARASGRKHDWLVFEAKAHRQQKSLSDIDGTEISIHGAKPVGVLRELTNVLERSRHRPTVQELQRIYRDIKSGAVKIKKDLATNSLYGARPFKELVMLAQLSAKHRVASLR
jgi:hypothetical protein